MNETEPVSNDPVDGPNSAHAQVERRGSPAAKRFNQGGLKKTGLEDSGEIDFENDNKSVNSLPDSNSLNESSLFDPRRQTAFRRKLAFRKEKNIANRNLQNFRKLVQKKMDSSNQISLQQGKMRLLPITLESDY